MADSARQHPSVAALGVFWLGLGACGLLGCETQTAALGEACTRTSQCAAGLACVAGECSADVAGLDRPGTVPMLMPEPADGGGAGVPADAGDDGGAAGDEDAG